MSDIMITVLSSLAKHYWRLPEGQLSSSPSTLYSSDIVPSKIRTKQFMPSTKIKVLVLTIRILPTFIIVVTFPGAVWGPFGKYPPIVFSVFAYPWCKKQKDCPMHWYGTSPKRASRTNEDVITKALSYLHSRQKMQCTSLIVWGPFTLAMGMFQLQS